MPSGAEIRAQPRQRALVQEAGEIVRGVGQQFAAAEPDEQVEDIRARRARRWFRLRPARARHARHRAASASPRKPARLSSSFASGARPSSVASSAYSCARATATSSGACWFCSGCSVEVGPQHFAVDAGRCLNNEHALGRNAVPIRYGRLRNTDLAREFTDAADGAYSFFEARIPHPECLDSNDFNVKVPAHQTAGQ